MIEDRPTPTVASEADAMREIRAMLGLAQSRSSESVVEAVRQLAGLRLGVVLQRAHADARAKGWHLRADWSDPQRQLAGLMLIATEIAEAAECVRVGQVAPMHGPDGKPEGLPSELADAVIRLGDYAGAMGIDLEAAVIEKAAYNKRRPQRHGGKLA